MAKPTDEFLGEVARDLEDPDFTVWSKSDLLNFLLEGLGQLAQYAPDEFVSDEDVTLVAGAEQDLPAGASYMVRPICTVVAGTPTTALRRAVSPDALDRANPTWRAAAQAATRQVAYALQNPRKFYVYPPAVADAVIRLALVMPTTTLDLDDNIPVDVIYIGPLKHYVMYRAYARDGDVAAQPARAAIHYEAFLNGVGAKNGADQ